MNKNEKVHQFKNSETFEKWLRTAYEGTEGVWLQLFKKDSGKATFTYQEALEVALCYGWIDGQKKSYDSESWIQRFSPRRKNSNWSQRNTALVEKLIADKRMRPAGLRLVEEAKANGRWESAYASPKEMKIPKDFLALLKKSKAAEKAFAALGKSDRYMIALNIETARTAATRERRIAAAIDTLKLKK